MGKFQAALWLGATTALLGGCAPTLPYPTYSMYAYAPMPEGGSQYGFYDDGVRPYLASYNRPYPSRPLFSQQYEPDDAPARRALLAQAHQALGTRYKFGGETPREGFDCSGLTQYVYRNANGINLPRTAAEQSHASRTISFNEMRPGDLIFFRTSGSTVNHVGIYIGRGQFIHAASGGAKVTVDNLSRPYWQQRLVKFGSFLA
ncbi:MAG TPA: C40 family peptidase [Candidatus Thiothrix moscowensis]|uniref:C40 family peptidase n=1 Tax=unclassified Thiothrix TaxID=2636184 RepID=UPI0025F3209A|nr:MULTISPECIES: C40 family peptidase [unclassified Thiothrix]HRJ53268.1 C40 family peptidase [Candidatus Thiothrix moscowensis]HRJ93162.1 C40 family peptidase [Candidatus Thiothrix moscowensis]